MRLFFLDMFIVEKYTHVYGQVTLVTMMFRYPSLDAPTHEHKFKKYNVLTVMFNKFCKILEIFMVLWHQTSSRQKKIKVFKISFFEVPLITIFLSRALRILCGHGILEAPSTLEHPLYQI